ncbi:MAG TPA: DUF4129 domain-containing protein [Gaiellaceae bacterium]|nr:DUF4129 domain-containing protein [Gaiellaceae bacterium]
MLGVRRGKGSDEPETVFEEPDTEWWEKPLLLGMALLPIAGLIAAVVVLVHHAKSVTNPTQTTGVTPPLTTAVATTPSQGASPHSSGLAVDWWLVAALAVVLAVAGAVLLFARRRRQRGLGVDSERRVSEEAFELQAVIEESLAELEREPDPRRAVIRAYTGMERTLARRGLGRRPFEAPLEYLARSLVALQVSRPAGERLTELFQRARFSTHDVEPASKQEAITALRRVRDELAERSE